MKLLQKIKKVGFTPANVIAWSSLELMRLYGALAGTIGLRLKAKLLGVELGKNVTAHGNVGLMRWPGGLISIGDHVSIISSWRRATAASLAFPARLRVFGKGAAIRIGEFCQLNGTSITARSSAITLGKQVMIGPNCVITDSDFHKIWPPEQRMHEPGTELDCPVTIGDYVWIGMGSIILKGSSIGSGAVIGAGSVVRGVIPSNCLAAGVPARVIRRLDQ